MDKFILLIVLFLTSCSILHKKKINPGKTEITYTNRPNIFLRDEKKIIEDIHIMFSERMSEYDRFKDNSIILNLLCDTITCRIVKIEIESKTEFVEYSKILVDYFNKLSPIVCYDEFWNRKVDRYDIIVGSKSSGLFMVIDYGYRMSKQK